MKYNVGDIVFVKDYHYENGNVGKSHLFVLIDDDGQFVPAEFFGMIVSSQPKEKPKFPFNEPLAKSDTNNLKKNSHVKCDQLYVIPEKNIINKIGAVDIDDYIRFMDTYNLFLSKIEKKLNEEEPNPV